MTDPLELIRIKSARDGLRRLSNIFGYVLFLLGAYLGATMAWGGHDRFKYASWQYAWQVPEADYVWGIPPLVVGVVGLLSLVFKFYHVASFACAIGSFWAFLLGAFLVASIPGVPTANLWWAALLWFISFSYTMVALTFADRYLV
jgi:hypothetical protein